MRSSGTRIQYAPIAISQRSLSLWSKKPAAETSSLETANNLTANQAIESPIENIVKIEPNSASETLANAAPSTLEQVDVTMLPRMGEALPDITTTVNAIESLGDFARLGLCSFSPLGLIEKIVEITYVSTGLPWWATIVTVTVLLRGLTIYPSIIGLRENQKLAAIQPKIGPLKEEAMKYTMQNDHTNAQIRTMKVAKIMKDAGVSYARVGIGMIQVSFCCFR